MIRLPLLLTAACHVVHTRAVKNNKGVHSKKESPIHKVSDLSGVSYIPAVAACGRSI